MIQTIKWMCLSAIAVVVLGICIWLGDVLLPWDTATRIGVGSSAGVVIGAMIAVWGSIALGEQKPISSHGRVVVNLLALDFEPAHLASDDTLELDYRIQLFSDEALLVKLGASLVGDDGSEYFDRAGDRSVHLVPGVFPYHRQLRVPRNTPPGAYRLIGAVWHPEDGGRQVARTDQGYVVQIKP